MVHAYHFILSAYGFWLPNDPRGSWSQFVASWELYRFGGKATTVDHTESVAYHDHDREAREGAKGRLLHAPVHFTGEQALAVSVGFAQAAREGDYRINACAILPEHCHLIVGRHDRDVGRISGHLKARATQSLKTRGLWEHAHSPWGQRYWAVFIDDDEVVERAIAYVNDNPLKEGKQPQKWSFVT